MTMRVLFLLVCFASTAEARSRLADKLHKQAQQAFDAAQYERAADLSGRELDALEANERGTPSELEIRERQVVSLFLSGRKIEARAAHAELLKRFRAFRFDADRVGPDVAQFFEPEVKAAPASVAAPIVIRPPPPPPPPAERKWRWYYLAPLGVGQFLAHSPVRGAIFLALEIGLLAANITGYAVIASQRIPGGVRDVRAATNAQIVMDIAFFGLIGTLIAGFVDGLAFEP